MVKLDNDIILDNENVNSLIYEIFGNINVYDKDSDEYVNYIKDRAIFSTKNEDIDDINEQIINKFNEKAHVYLSADSVQDKDSVYQNLYRGIFKHFNAKWYTPSSIGSKSWCTYHTFKKY